MKRKILLSLMLIMNVCFAHETWKDDWVMAVNLCNEKDYKNAEIYFNQSISLMESEEDTSHSHVYVDRARLYLLLGRYEEALPDLNKALNSGNLSRIDHERALVSLIATKSNLQMNSEVLADLKIFGEAYAPVVENTRNKVYIRNVPDCECFKSIITCYFIHSGICKSKDNVHMMKSGICIIDKNCDCGCEEEEDTNQNEKICDACGEIYGVVTSPQCTIDGCKSWCDANTIVGTAWCSKVFKAPHCQAACYAAVYVIQQGCYWCCEGGNIYKKCLKPFERIVDYIQAPCDPLWD